MIVGKPRRTPWQRSPYRLAAFAALTAIALIVLVVRLVQVQLVHGAQYRAAALENQVRLIPVAAPRGIIYDRDKRVLVRSRPSFVVGLIPSEVTHIDAELARLAQAIDVPEATLRHRLLHHRGIDYANFNDVVAQEPYGPVLLASDLQVPQVARLSELLSDLPGVDLEAEPIRDYPMGKAGSHLFGFVGQISEDEYMALKNQGYSPNDVIGKDGLEAQYDRLLRGAPGGQRIVVDAAGDAVPGIKLPAKRATPGDSLVLSVDWRLQAIVESALQSHMRVLERALGRRLSAAVVVEDPYTGGILALASYPNFDPNAFATQDNKKIESYLHDPANPLYDFAIAAESPTGSTFMMVTGSAAITEGVVKVNEIVYDSGEWNCGGYIARDIASGGLGRTTFVPALAASSDGYFYQMSWRLGQARLRKWALLFGLSKPSGIDLPGEVAGNWPTNAWSLRVTGLPMEPSDTCFLGIGQGAMQATPLQITNVASAVINGGTLWVPHVVDSVIDPQGKVVRRYGDRIIRHVPASQEALAAVREGMAEVTGPGGTAYGLAIPGLPFSGKTGTAETGGGYGPNTTWFVAWAPTAHPKLAMTVFVDRSGGYGASIAAPIAQEVLIDYFHPKVKR
jgi:penicillin-binding protein 2